MLQASVGSYLGRWLAITALMAAGVLAISMTAASDARGADRAASAAKHAGKLSTIAVIAKRRAVRTCRIARHVGIPAAQRQCRRAISRLREARVRARAVHQLARTLRTQGTKPSPSELDQTGVRSQSKSDIAQEPVSAPPKPEGAFAQPDDEPEGVKPRCDLVPGDCDIYSDEFWILRERYEQWEINSPGEQPTYPYHPECIEAGMVCITLIHYLLPDGTIGPTLEQPDDEPEGVKPRCDLVPGDCDIYSDEFWILRERYEHLELKPTDGRPSYPTHPECLEAEMVCPAVIHYLYPDGTFGMSVWVVDPDAPDGWRLWNRETDGPDPIAP